MLNTENTDALIALVDSVEKKVATPWVPRISAPINMFWRRMTASEAEGASLPIFGSLLQQELETVLADFYRQMTEVWIDVSERISTQNSKQAAMMTFVSKQVSEETRLALIAWITQSAKSWAKRISESVVSEARNFIARRLSQGVDLAVIAREMASNLVLLPGGLFRSARKDAETHARTIIRTEAMRTYSETTSRFIQSSGLTITRKTWVTAQDEHVRSSHGALHQATIPIASDFDCGGVPAAYPRDPRLPPRQSINCRCLLVYHEAGSSSAPALTPSAAIN